YAPLVAHAQGLNFVKKEHPQVHLSPVEYLEKDVGIFSASSPYFDDGVNSPSAAKKYYYEFLEARGITLDGAARRGYGGLDIAYVFSHSAPDNSIPLLWWDENGWIPLFDR
ncbi:MAG: hypothetical protein OQK32_02240, partial [Gammaproteobacteria bacterium]|nr:hypothetical protein [Gammaproteobacteria bacterium]